MKLWLESRPRMPRVPLWAFALIAIWGSLVGFIQWFGQQLPEAPVICHLRLFTGIPCPTCGSTRALMAILDGRPLDAFLFNPLMFVLGLATALILGVRLIWGKQLLLQLSAPQKNGAWVVAVVVFFFNWGYVIVSHQSLS